MRAPRILLIAGLVAMVTSPAWAVSVQLPPNGNMNIDAFGSFAEIFIEVTADAGVDIGGVHFAKGSVLNNLAIGYAPSIPDFVLYTGASSSVSAAQTPPTTVVVKGAANIKDFFTGANDSGTIGRLYVGGIIQSISSGSPTQTVTYPTSPADSNPNAQLTFALANAYVQDLTLDALTAGGQQGFITTVFQLATPNTTHLDIWADQVADASLTGSPTGQRYQSATTAANPAQTTPELPVRDTDGTLMVDLNKGDYHDNVANAWGDLGFANDGSDTLFWSFVGNPSSNLTVSESFAVAGETLTLADGLGTLAVRTQGPSDIEDPGFQIQGQFIPGASLAYGTGVGNNLLADDYILSANFAFGSSPTGTYDSDPSTFTFQQGAGAYGTTLTRLQGTLVPEPLTMASLLLGIGCLSRYVRKRR